MIQPQATPGLPPRPRRLWAPARHRCGRRSDRRSTRCPTREMSLPTPIGRARTRVDGATEHPGVLVGEPLCVAPLGGRLDMTAERGRRGCAGPEVNIAVSAQSGDGKHKTSPTSGSRLLDRTSRPAEGGGREQQALLPDRVEADLGPRPCPPRPPRRAQTPVPQCPWTNGVATASPRASAPVLSFDSGRPGHAAPRAPARTEHGAGDLTRGHLAVVAPRAESLPTRRSPQPARTGATIRGSRARPARPPRRRRHGRVRSEPRRGSGSGCCGVFPHRVRTQRGRGRGGGGPG